MYAGTQFKDVPACALGEPWRIPSLSRSSTLRSVPSSADSAPAVRPSLLLAAFAGIVLILGTLQYLATPGQMQWIYFLQRLYYIPVVLAGLTVGWRGGLFISLLAAAAFVIATPPIWTVTRAEAFDQGLEGCVFCLVGGLCGALTDRHRRQEANLRKAANDLRAAHLELEKNLGRIARAERIYALAQLSAGLAHEIRTPLASLEGAASLVRREAQTEERRREFLDIIQKESRRLNRLLTTFLEFARPRHPDLQNVKIEEVLDGVIFLVGHANDMSGIELRKQIEPGLPILECDPEQLKQVLLNLIMNANQAMPHGGTVILEAHRDVGSVNIDVHDQGSGIDEENLERVFDPFFTTKESGTGLGLSVAHQIVSQHKGMLTIARNSPNGVTVRISLPIPSGQP